MKKNSEYMLKAPNYILTVKCELINSYC